MLRIIFIVIFFIGTLNCHAWNWQGHHVMAQIAYDNLTPAAKKMCRKYLSTHSKHSPNDNFITASTWLDRIKYKNIHRYDALHYIDIPFSTDKQKLPAIEGVNAVWGINNAISLLTSKKIKKSDKRLALLILIHLVGDIHQPLHTVTKVSNQLPRGDFGGNLFLLGRNPIAKNLHQYWDKGAGFFSGYGRMDQIKAKAHLLERKYPCRKFVITKNPEQWAKASHAIALEHVYKIKSKEIPKVSYKKNSQKIAKKQIAIAGCQLAGVINAIAKEHH